MRCNLPTRLCLVLPVLLAAAASAQAGAWPRGEGQGFASLKYTARLDDGDADGAQAYGEWGVRPRLTFGAEVSRAIETDAETDVRAFASYAFLERGPHVASAEIGAGVRGDETFYLRPGLAWGRGYDSRFGGGWMEVVGQAEIYADGDDPAFKLDATLGLNLSDRLAALVQARAGDYPGSEPYLRLAPSAALRLRPWLRVQAEVEAGVVGDGGPAATVALWIDF